jgi:predicted nucleic acid-binding protein
LRTTFEDNILKFNTLIAMDQISAKPGRDLRPAEQDPPLVDRDPRLGEPLPPAGPYLLDANTLVALIDPHHCQHRAVRRWFEEQAPPRGWATCPACEALVFAVMGHPDYPGRLGLEAIALRLSVLRCSPGHQVWTESVDLLPREPWLLWQELPGCSALVDLQLLALARSHDGVLVTLGRRLALQALRGSGPSRCWLPLEDVLAAGRHAMQGGVRLRRKQG